MDMTMNSFHSNFALDLSIKSIKLQTPYLQESLNSAKNAGRWHALLASSIGGNKRATPKNENQNFSTPRATSVPIQHKSSSNKVLRRILPRQSPVLSL
jgi:hypothetical protein